MSPYMPILIGATLALVVSAYAAWIHFDRDRAFYPTVVMVVASYYVLFSVMGGSARSTVVETSIMGVFVAAASLGFKRNLWVAVAGLAGHGILDAFHGSLVYNPGVPPWWPPFCGAYDLMAGAILAMILLRDPPLSKPRTKTLPMP